MWSRSLKKLPFHTLATSYVASECRKPQSRIGMEASWTGTYRPSIYATLASSAIGRCSDAAAERLSFPEGNIRCRSARRQPYRAQSLPMKARREQAIRASVVEQPCERPDNTVRKGQHTHTHDQSERDQAHCFP